MHSHLLDARKADKGMLAHLSGQSAEGIAARHYVADGCQVAEHRWRGIGGELDLILKDRGKTIFVEVKKSKTHALAAEKVSVRQLQNIQRAAQEYLGLQCDNCDQDMRIDVALVDSIGAVEILENVTMH